MWGCENCPALWACRRQVISGGPFARTICNDALKGIRPGSGKHQVLACVMESDCPMTSEEVAQATGIGLHRVQVYLCDLRREGLIRTAEVRNRKSARFNIWIAA